MLKFLVVLAALFPVSVWAVDVTSSFAIVRDGAVILESTTKVSGMTESEAAKLRVRADRVLSHASKLQDKGGPYTLRFTWNSEPTVETAGLKFGGVNSTMRQARNVGDEILRDAEAAEKAGKKAPWGK